MKTDTTWQEAEDTVKKIYPQASGNDRLKLINMYLTGYQHGLRYARKVFDEK